MGSAQTGIARLNPDGTTDLEFHRNMKGISGGEGRVDAIALQPDGKILIGGSFTTVNTRASNNIARLDSLWECRIGFLYRWRRRGHGQQRLQHCRPTGRKNSGGGRVRESWGQQARKHIARFNADATLDATFAPGDVNNIIYSMALQADGKIVIVGEFTQVNGQSRSKVARLNADGSLDETYLNGASGANSLVRWVDLDPQGNAIIGGWFTTMNGVSFNRVARLSAVDGSPDLSFQQGLGTIDNGVRSLEVQRDGSIVIGGEFTEVYGVECQFLARLTLSGALASPFACGSMTSIYGGASGSTISPYSQMAILSSAATSPTSTARNAGVLPASTALLRPTCRWFYDETKGTATIGGAQFADYSEQEKYRSSHRLIRIRVDQGDGLADRWISSSIA